MEITPANVRPHMKRRKGESQADYDHRIAHSCYRCGHYERDLRVLAEHEDGHRAPVSDE